MTTQPFQVFSTSNEAVANFQKAVADVEEAISAVGLERAQIPPAVTAAYNAAALALQQAGILGSYNLLSDLTGKPAGSYRVGQTFVLWSGAAVQSQSSVLASQADLAAQGVSVQAAAASAAQARPSPIARTLGRLATPGTRTTIVCTGDSITQAGHYGLTDPQGWTGVLAQLLAVRYPLHTVEYVTLSPVTTGNALYELEMGNVTTVQVQAGDGKAGVIRVIREGIGGSSISRLIGRSKAIWSGPATAPDLVLEMTGINDSLDGTRHSEPAEYARMLAAFVRQVRAYTDADVALMSAHWNGTGLNSATNLLLDTYAASVRTVAASEGTAYIPIREEWLAHNIAVGGTGLKGQGDRYTSPNTRDPSDDAHPGATGHTAIAGSVMDALFGPLAPQGLSAPPIRSLRKVALSDLGLTYTGNWVSETLTGYDGTLFDQRVSRTTGDTLSFRVQDVTQAQMLAQMLHTNPATVGVNVNGNAQSNVSLAPLTGFYDSEGTAVSFAPGQGFSIFGGGSPPDLYTVTLTNLGGEWRFDGLLLDGVLLSSAGSYVQGSLTGALTTTAGTPTLLPFQVLAGNGLALSGGVFTADKAGIYTVAASAYLNGNSQFMELYVQAGTQNRRFAMSNLPLVAGNTSVYLPAGGQAKVYILATAALSVNQSTDFTSLFIARG